MLSFEIMVILDWTSPKSIALYYLPIVFSMTRHNFIPSLCMVIRLENVAKCCMSYRTFQYGIVFFRKWYKEKATKYI